MIIFYFFIYLSSTLDTSLLDQMCQKHYSSSKKFKEYVTIMK